MTYSVMWPVEDIEARAVLHRDYLPGVNEAAWRSARLLPWCNVYEEYYAAEYQKRKDFIPPFDAMERHQQYQEAYPAPSNIDWDVATQGPIPVYGDYDDFKEYLKDPRFKLVAHPRDAKILYLTSEYWYWAKAEGEGAKDFEIDYATTYVSWFGREGALVDKAALADLINCTLKDTSCI